jgi:hypothetical protein
MMAGDIMLFFTGVLVGLMISVSIAEQSGIDTHARIVEHGCGEYNKTTGDFQWVNE